MEYKKKEMYSTIANFRHPFSFISSQHKIFQAFGIYFLKHTYNGLRVQQTSGKSATTR